MIKYGASLACLIALLLAAATSFAGVSVTTTVAPSSNQGKCPVSVMVTGKITATQAGTVNYEYVLSSGVKMPGTIHFNAPGTQEVSAGFVAGSPSLPQYPTSGWAAINITNQPGVGMSNKANWNFTCKNPDLVVTSLTWTPYKTPSMKAPLPLGSVLFNYKNQGTGESGPYKLRLSCEGVAGTGPFGQTPLCPEGIFPKTWPFSSSLAPGEATGTGIVGASGSMPPKWGGGKYRITAEAELADNASESGPYHEYELTNNQKVLEIEVAWAKLTDVQFMTVEGINYQGECSSQKNATILNAKIAGNGYGVIKYQWIIDGVPSGSPSELTYRVDDMLDEVSVVTIPLQNKTGTGAIKIISPGQKQSNTATYTIACTNGGFDSFWLGSLSTTFGKWKNLGNLSPAAQACTGCAATFNEIGSLDRQSLPLVKEGEGLTQKLKLGRLSKGEADQITRRLNEISKLLDANLVKRNGLVNQYNNQLNSFNAQPRKLTPLSR